MRRPRNYQKYLTVEYAIQHPGRLAKTEFSDEVLAVLAFVMRQIDPTGTKPMVLPPMPAYEGYEPQGSVRSSGDAEMEG